MRIVSLVLLMGWVFFSTFECDQLEKIHQHDGKKTPLKSVKHRVSRIVPSFPDCCWQLPCVQLIVCLKRHENEVKQGYDPFGLVSNLAPLSWPIRSQLFVCTCLPAFFMGYRTVCICPLFVFWALFFDCPYLLWLLGTCGNFTKTNVINNRHGESWI